jgi:acetyl esterase/lipase
MTTRRTLIATAALAPALASPVRTLGQTAEQEEVAVETRRDIVYGEVGGQELLLDAFLPPPREKARPAVILIHGGGWSGGRQDDMAGPARELAKAGYAAFSVSYRLVNPLLEETRWPVQLDDVQRAVRWVRAHAGASAFNLDPERVASYGYSAGGHLAMMLGLRETRDNNDPALAGFSSRVTCVVSLGGDMDLTVPQTDSGFELMISQLLGGSTGENPEAYRDASPISWVDAESAPALIAHGGIDDLILAEQSRRMVAAMYDAGVESVYAAIPKVGHGGIGQWALMGPLALTFLGARLHPHR